MRQAWWVVGHVGGALALAAGMVAAAVILRRRLTPGCAVGRYLLLAARVFCLCALAWLGTRTGQAAWRVTSANRNDPSCLDVGLFARAHLPENAVLLCEEKRGGEHLTTMFFANRTCYALERDPNLMARQVCRAGGVPYLVSYRRLSLPPVHASVGQSLTVYRWQPP
jgi:hypothetical protein